MHTPLKFLTLPAIFFVNLYQDAGYVLVGVRDDCVLCCLALAHPLIWAQPFGASSSSSQGAVSAAASGRGAVAGSILILCSSAAAVRGTLATFPSGVVVGDSHLEASTCASFPADTVVAAPAADAGAGASAWSTSSLVPYFAAHATRPCLVGLTTVSGVAGILRLALGGVDIPDLVVPSMCCGWGVPSFVCSNLPMYLISYQLLCIFLASFGECRRSSISCEGLVSTSAICFAFVWRHRFRLRIFYYILRR